MVECEFYRDVGGLKLEEIKYVHLFPVFHISTIADMISRSIYPQNIGLCHIEFSQKPTQMDMIDVSR